MRYPKIRKAIFLDRSNRFIAHVLLEGKIRTVHVKNTGRCKELLVPDATVYLEESDNPARKTKYDLIAVEKVVTDERTASQKNNPHQHGQSGSQQSGRGIDSREQNLFSKAHALKVGIHTRRLPL